MPQSPLTQNKTPQNDSCPGNCGPEMFTEEMNPVSSVFFMAVVGKTTHASLSSLCNMQTGPLNPPRRPRGPMYMVRLWGQKTPDRAARPNGSSRVAPGGGAGLCKKQFASTRQGQRPSKPQTENPASLCRFGSFQRHAVLDPKSSRWPDELPGFLSFPHEFPEQYSSPGVGSEMCPRPAPPGKQTPSVCASSRNLACGLHLESSAKATRCAGPGHAAS